MVLALADDLGAKRGCGALPQELVVVLVNVDLLLNAFNSLGGDIASLLEAISNLKGVNTLIKEPLGLLEESASEHDDTSGTVTDFVVLGLGELDEEASGLVLNLHLLKNCGTVVGHDDITVRADEHLIHTLGAEGSSHEASNGSCGEDVRLNSS
jgi:hypothetical protein